MPSRPRTPRRPHATRHGVALAAAALLLATAACSDTNRPLVTNSGATLSATPLASATAPAATPAPTPTPALTLPPVHPDPARLERAEVVHVVDGDTIDVELNGARERVRYYGIDTPERGQPCFKEATARNTELIGGAVLLLPDARERDRYGRLLRYVFDSSGQSVDERLIAEGFAHAWRSDGAYRNEFVALEDDAHALGLGCLWSQ